MPRAGDAKELVLIETRSSAKDGKVTTFPDEFFELHRQPAEVLLHYKTGSEAYGIEEKKYLVKPLFMKTTGGADNCLLNELFC